jgi:two-component system repressor protein LuxO
LRFIQTGTFQAVGSNTLKKVNIRFICATNRNPLIEVEAGRFREDLYYRLHVIPITLPSLSQRDDDVLMIARKFLQDYSQEENKNFRGFSAETEQIFLNYAWPGNVRQLQNIIRNMVVLNNGELIESTMLPSPLDYDNRHKLLTQTHHTTIAADNTFAQTNTLLNLDDTTSILPLAEIEKRVIEHAINMCAGNIPKAAIQLGISASTIYRKKQTWENLTK